jgi:uncharacterized RDD family membrane protein YckC
MSDEPAITPPPTIPPPTIPPPDLPQGPPDGGAPPVSAPGPASVPGPVHVRVREGGGDEENPESGAAAPFNSRILAALIDLAIAGGLMVGAIMILPGFAEKLGWLIGAAYLVARDSLPFLGGQSVGKTAMKLKAVTLDDKDLIGKWETALVRNAVLAIPIFPLVELFVLLSREDSADRGRRLGDIWAKTKVIVAPVAEVTPPDAET